MNILICNDDGIHASGIRTLIDALKEDYDLYVAAPSGQRSASSHSVTYFFRENTAEKIMMEGVKEAYAIDGTPADCCYYGLNGLFDSKMDLVISGINHGRNLASDVIYSGTVAAAGEAVIQGTAGMAISLCSYSEADYTAAACAAKTLIPHYMADPSANRYILNVNVPPVSKDQIRGFRVCPLNGNVDYARPITKIHAGNNLLKLRLENDDMKDPLSAVDGMTDVQAVENGYIAVTPMTYDLYESKYTEWLNYLHAITEF